MLRGHLSYGERIVPEDNKKYSMHNIVVLAKAVCEKNLKTVKDSKLRFIDYLTQGGEYTYQKELASALREAGIRDLGDEGIKMKAMGEDVKFLDC